MNTKADIDAELARLESRLSELVAGLPADEVLEAFSSESKPLVERVPAEHYAYVHGRINCLLAAAGLIAGEAEGEPCPSGD